MGILPIPRNLKKHKKTTRYCHYLNIIEYAGALYNTLVHFLLWQAAKPSGDKCTPLKATSQHLNISTSQHLNTTPSCHYT